MFLIIFSSAIVMNERKMIFCYKIVFKKMEEGADHPLLWSDITKYTPKDLFPRALFG